MSELVQCGCGTRLRVATGAELAVCPRCGAEHTPSSAPHGEIIWAEDREEPARPVRTDPPRHAEAMADQILARVAGGTRTRRRPKPPAWRTALVGFALLVMAGLIYRYDLDVGFVRVPSVGLGFGGLVTLLKVAMGYTR